MEHVVYHNPPRASTQSTVWSSNTIAFYLRQGLPPMGPICLRPASGLRRCSSSADTTHRRHPSGTLTLSFWRMASVPTPYQREPGCGCAFNSDKTTQRGTTTTFGLGNFCPLTRGYLTRPAPASSPNCGLLIHQRQSFFNFGDKIWLLFLFDSKPPLE